MHKSSIDGVLELIEPDNPLPLVFDSPHSGTIYPEDFNYVCEHDALVKSEDKYVDDLFSDAPEHGATLLKALFARAYIDVNRAVNDIDPELIAPKHRENWPYKDIELNPTKRSKAGIGLIKRLVAPGASIYDHYLSPKDIKSRIETCYNPYHTALEDALDKTYAQHGCVYHINCHSMPSSQATSGALGRINPFSSPDFVLGDRNGTSCGIELTHAIRDFLKNLGYKVAINDPYKGVELVERYSNPAQGRHSLQIEINRALYMNEETFEKSKNYEKLKADITDLIKFCVECTANKLT